MSGTKRVYVSGVGISKFGQNTDLSPLEMAAHAIHGALETASLPLAKIEEMFVGNALGNAGIVAGIAEGLGIAGIPVTRVEQACASGSTAVRLACESVGSGRRTTVLVPGIEKMGSGLLQLDDQPTYEARLGLDVFPLLYALKARQYSERYGATTSDLASIAVKARQLGALAPHAATEKSVTLAEVLASPVIADPVTRLQCCRNASGAAAALVTSAPVAAGMPEVAGWIGGVGIEDTAQPMHGGWDSREQIVKQLGDRLYAASGIGPSDIGVVQVNDAFTVAEPLYLEALGFAPKGEGIKLQRDGDTGLGGRVPTNTDGGLIGRGHALGATGVAMVYEIWTQLLGNAGPRQIARQATAGLVQSHGYGGENLFILKL